LTGRDGLKGRCSTVDDADRFRLLGTYRTPRFRIGRTVFCEVRGAMVITGRDPKPTERLALTT
jgi:hypothetical protein